MVVAWASVIVVGIHVVGKILVEMIRIVVIEVETLRGVILRFMDFRDANHEDFTAKILNFLVLLA